MPDDGLLDGVRQWLVESGAEPTPARVAQALRERGRVLGDAEVLGAAERLRSELVGSGPLEPLLADPSVTDVLVSAPDRVWVDRGGGLELTEVSFPDAAAVRRLAQRLAAVAGRRLDDARPWVDARLPDGTRLHAVLPPVAVGSTCLSLRVVRPRAFTLAELVTAGTVPPGGDRVLRALIRARLSYVISGGTGTGNPNLSLERLCIDLARRVARGSGKGALTCGFAGQFCALRDHLGIEGACRKRPRRASGVRQAGAAGIVTGVARGPCRDGGSGSSPIGRRALAGLRLAPDLAHLDGSPGAALPGVLDGVEVALQGLVAACAEHQASPRVSGSGVVLSERAQPAQAQTSTLRSWAPMRPWALPRLTAPLHMALPQRQHAHPED